jgi:hypothetical protein
MARAGAFISLDRDGHLFIERGYVRPEDEAPAAPGGEGAADTPATAGDAGSGPRIAVITVGGEPAEVGDDEAEQDGIRPLSERLVAELTAQCTLALRDAVAQAPDAAFQAVLHALCLAFFYRYARTHTCMEIEPKSENFASLAASLRDSASARAIETRHGEWQARLPQSPNALWDALTSALSLSERRLAEFRMLRRTPGSLSMRNGRFGTTSAQGELAARHIRPGEDRSARAASADRAATVSGVENRLSNVIADRAAKTPAAECGRHDALQGESVSGGDPPSRDADRADAGAPHAIHATLAAGPDPAGRSSGRPDSARRRSAA